MEWALSNEAPQALVPAKGGKPIFNVPVAPHHDFEAYVYAALQCGDWYVEPNPREMDLVNEFLFELDAVARKPFGATRSRSADEFRSFVVHPRLVT
jgi:hypothetical protein